jgi:hypothetical protein
MCDWISVNSRSHCFISRSVTVRLPVLKLLKKEAHQPSNNQQHHSIKLKHHPVLVLRRRLVKVSKHLGTYHFVSSLFQERGDATRTFSHLH